MSTPTYAFTCGGTGGHVYPAVALAQAFQDSSQARPLFIGSTNRQDAQIIPKYGFLYEGIGQSSRKILDLIKAFLKAREVLKKYQVQAVIGAGGGYTAAVVVAAFTLRIPIFLLEQNAIPGRTNRYLQGMARRVYLTFPESEAYFSKSKRLCVGNPVRRYFLEDALSKAFLAEALPDLPIVLIFGGSQGAQKLNQLMADHYDYFLNHPIVAIHVTGQSYYQAHFKETPYTLLAHQGQTKVAVLPYFEKMDALYERVSLVICRAGATTMAELIHFQKRAVLIPFPFAKDNHQVANAKSFQSQGLGIYYEESQLTFDRLMPHFESLQAQKIADVPENNIAANTIMEDIHGLLRASH